MREVTPRQAEVSAKPIEENQIWNMRLIFLLGFAVLVWVGVQAKDGFRGEDCRMCFNPYKELGVSPASDSTTTRKAYLRLLHSRNGLSSNPAAQRWTLKQAWELIVLEREKAALREQEQVFEEAVWNNEAFRAIPATWVCVVFAVLVPVVFISMIRKDSTADVEISNPDETHLDVPTQEQVMLEPLSATTKTDEVSAGDASQKNALPEIRQSVDAVVPNGDTANETPFVSCHEGPPLVLSDVTSAIPEEESKMDFQLEATQSYPRDFQSGSDADDEEEPRYPVPRWAEEGTLVAAVRQQLVRPADLDEIFEDCRLKGKVKLGSVFGGQEQECCARTSMDSWTCSPLPLGTYKPLAFFKEAFDENKENGEQLVPATGTSAGKQRKPFQLVPENRSEEVEMAPVADTIESDEVAVPVSCGQPEKAGDGTLRVKAVKGVFENQQGGCDFYLIEYHGHPHHLDHQWDAECQLPDAVSARIDRLVNSGAKSHLYKWPCTLSKAGRTVRKATGEALWVADMEGLLQRNCYCAGVGESDSE